MPYSEILGPKQCKQLASNSQGVRDPKESLINQYILSLQLLKKSLLPLQKADIRYVKCKDSTKQSTLWQEFFCSIYSAVKLGIAKLCKLHTCFLAPSAALIEVRGNFATD